MCHCTRTRALASLSLSREANVQRSTPARVALVCALVEFDVLAFFEGVEDASLHGRGVEEEVFRSPLGSNEAEASVAREPLDLSGCHGCLLSPRVCSLIGR